MTKSCDKLVQKQPQNNEQVYKKHQAVYRHRDGFSN